MDQGIPIAKIPEGYEVIEVEKFKQVWEFLKIKIPVDKFMETYDQWERIYKHSRLTEMPLQEIVQLRCIYHFKGATIDVCRKQLINFISKNKQFYHDDIAGMIDLMQEERDRLNAEREDNGEFTIDYINLFPEYGGRLQDPKNANAFEKQMYKDNEAKMPFE